MAKKVLKLACIFLASGRSKRFGENKLLAEFDGVPMIDLVFKRFPCELFNQTIVVTRYAGVAVSAAGFGFTVVENDDETGDIARTIRLGLDAFAADYDGCMFSVCDQPLLRAESIERLCAAWRGHPQGIAALGFAGKRGNPVIFPRALFAELRALPPSKSGGAVIQAHEELLSVVNTESERELIDVDYQSDLEKLRK